MADDDSDDSSINASLTNLRTSCSKWSQRSKVRSEAANCVVRTKPAASSLRRCGSTNQQSQMDVAVLSAFDLREECLFNADRLDCLRAQQELGRQRAVPSSQCFNSLQSMLAGHDISEPMPEITEPLPCTSTDIVQDILRDFCASPSYVEEEEKELASSAAKPRFRFQGKQIKFYTRKPTKKFAVSYDIEEDEDRLSCCSSELSVQEYCTTQVPKTTHCAFDVNSSQKICENLLNLSAYFTQNNANKSIDLPEMPLKDCTLMNTVEYFEEDATDFLKDMGYIIGNTEQCIYLKDNCDIKDKSEFSLFEDHSRLLDKDHPVNCRDDDVETKEKTRPSTKTSNQASETSDCDLFEGIILSEWQPMHITDAVKLPDKNTEETSLNAISDCNPMEIIAFSEWQPMELPDAPASNKTMEISAMKQQKDAGQENLHDNASELIQFRTASNKSVKLSEEMKRKAAMLLADLEKVDINQHDAQTLDQPLDMITGFRTASNKTIEVTAQMQKAAQNLMADLETNKSFKKEMSTDCEMLAGIPMDIPGMQQKQTGNANPQVGEDICSQFNVIQFSEWQPLDIPAESEFRTASNRTTVISDVDLATSSSQRREETSTAMNAISENAERTEFRTASNKTVKLSQEMQRKGAMLMLDLESVQQKELTRDYHKMDQLELKPCLESGNGKSSNADNYVSASYKIQFHTASNKVVKLTEEMRKRAAQLMADLDKGTGDEYETTVSQMDVMQSEEDTPKHCPLAKDQKELKRKETTIAVDGTTPFEPEAKSCMITTTPQKPQLISGKVAATITTPKCTLELQSSLTQLTHRSPLDRATKSSIIMRRNLLSLNKRRKQKRDVENCNVDAGQTPIRHRFAPTPASTSTPMPKRKENVGEDSQLVMRERSCSQESPRVRRERVGKRKSEDALSPIYAPTNKTRRLGLSRKRNKSSNVI